MSLNKIKPFIVALEGIDNCGKTTIAGSLAARLRESGYRVVVSKELSTPIGRLVLDSFSGNIPKLSPLMKTLLFAADRQERIEDISSEEIDIAIFDRYVYSAKVYRLMEQVNENWVDCVNSIFPEADLTFYIDVDIDISIQRGEMAGKSCPYTKEQLRSCLNLYRQYSKQGHFVNVPKMSQNDAMNLILKRIESEFN